MKRIDGSLYKEQVDEAVKRYKTKYTTPDVVVNISGYQRFLEAKKWKEEKEEQK